MDDIRKQLLKELSSLPTSNADYMGTNRPCVDIAVVLDVVRGKEFKDLTEQEKDEEFKSCYGL